MGRLDFLCIAVLVDDVKQPVDVGRLDVERGSLETIHQKPKLSIEQIESSHYGGGGNIAPVAKILGLRTGIMGYIGNDYEGEFFIRGMEKCGINTDGIVKTKWHTDVSIIPKDKDGKRGPIAFFEGAGRYFDMTENIKEKIYLLKPRIVQIGYSGLFDKGADRNKGKNLAEMVEWIKSIGSVVMVDTHTYTSQPKKYDLLKPSLHNTDLFMCSNDEVELMIGQYNIKCFSESDEISKAYSFLEYLQGKFWIDVEEPRIFAVTAKDYVIIKYFSPNKGVITKFIKNYYSSVKAVDAVGAGDSFKAGFNTYIVKNLNVFKNGNLKLDEAVQFANLTALLYISGKGTEAFKDYKYKELLGLIKRGRPAKPYYDIKKIYSGMVKEN
ncbi:carbohydrate kinase family protein [candidate division KSB1 bacterium]